ncbi:MAG: ABC transporter substrate-binding protein [Desulfomonile tiedjei]|uniref:ABC transporter substrate-binding protein n=1 Tax=Desulfomonile tiedjei TaxID=2358 RepID=A0A9D6UYM9_9BACT|nr:ABC transporter substrate-binding protein [Desulfomonile tiedjei]
MCPKKTSRLFALLLTLLLVGIYAGASAEVGVSDTSVVVGCSNSLSGPLAFTGTELIKFGTELYFNHINEKGGIHGRKLTLKTYDDAYDPTKAVSNTKKLVMQDGVFCILSPQGSSPIFATLEYLEQEKVPLIFPFQGSPLQGKTIFTSFTSYPKETEIVLHWLVEKKGFKRIGMIYQDDKYGHLYRDQALETLKSMGMELVALESVKRGAIDLSAQMAKLGQANLDALCVVLVPGPAAMVIKEAKKAGWTNTKLVASGPVTDEKFIVLAGGESDGVWGFSLWPDPVHSQRPAMVEYRKILEKYAPGHAANRYSLFGYFYAKAFCEALQRAGKDLTRESMIKAAEGIQNWENGIITPVSFSETDHAAQEDGFMVEVKGNVFKPISGWLSLEKGKLTERPLGE